MNNKKVLACQMDRDLRKKMEEHRKNKNLTVTDYVIGLITEDLVKNGVLTKSNANATEQQKEITKQETVTEDKIEIPKEENIQTKQTGKEKSKKTNEKVDSILSKELAGNKKKEEKKKQIENGKQTEEGEEEFE